MPTECTQDSFDFGTVERRVVVGAFDGGTAGVHDPERKWSPSARVLPVIAKAVLFPVPHRDRFVRERHGTPPTARHARNPRRCRKYRWLEAQVLVPSERRGRDAVAAVPRDVFMRLDIATAFDCPFDGRVDEAARNALLERLIPLRPNAEICLCDTTGRADPAHVDSLFAACMQRFPQVHAWALYSHDTYGLGLANVYAAYRRGVRVFDASFGGAGCPFAPGATGCVANEDVVWMFDRMGISTGIDLVALVPVASDGAALPGGTPRGRVRDALRPKSDARPAAANCSNQHVCSHVASCGGTAHTLFELFARAESMTPETERKHAAQILSPNRPDRSELQHHHGD